MTEMYIAIGITLLGILLSALYSGLETGLYTVNKIRLDVRSLSGVTSAKRLVAIINRPARMLAVLLVCNNVANYLASYGAARLLEETTLGPWMAIIVNAMVMIPILFIFGEVLPKDLFRSHTDTWTYKWSATLFWTDKILWWSGIVPIVAAVGKIARVFLGDEGAIEPSPRRRFGLLFKEGLEGGVLSAEQTTLADRVLAMRQTEGPLLSGLRYTLACQWLTVEASWLEYFRYLAHFLPRRKLRRTYSKLLFLSQRIHPFVMRSMIYARAVFQWPL